MKIKICGITTLQDALTAIEAGADILGFNFYPQSPRYIPPASCASILRLLGDFKRLVTGVGVFVNSTVQEMTAILDETGLELAQLSGDEMVETVEALGGRGFKAMRLASNSGSNTKVVTQASVKLIQEYAGSRKGEAPAFLLDSLVRGAYGGTGVVADWEQAASLADQYPFLLAGGLTAENIGEAVGKVRPWGVDVASGVESIPGRKDESKIRQFIHNARMAEQRINDNR